MDDAPDHELLQRFISHRDEAAFQALVRRHLDLVHATARRVTGSDDLARDAAQSTFIRLARRATVVPQRVPLAAWLHRTCRSLAIDLTRAEARRQRREQRAASEHHHAYGDLQSRNLPHSPHMDPAADDSAWAKLSPLIDELVDQLPGGDREVVLLRYYQNRTYGAVGEMLGVSEEAARKRSSRALDRLRTLLGRRGIATTSAALAMLLPAHAAVTATAPASLAVAIFQSTRGVLPAIPAGTLSQLIVMTTTHKLSVACALVIVLSTASYTTPWRSAEQIAAARGGSIYGESRTSPESGLRARPDRSLRPLPVTAEERRERLRAILEMEDAVERRRELLAFVSVIPPELFAEILGDFSSLGRGDRDDERRLLLLAWAKVGPQEAMAYASLYAPDELRHVAGYWATYDPDAAMAWARAHPRTEQFGWRDGGNDLLTFTLAGIARTDAPRALTLIEELPADQRRGALRVMVEFMLHDADPLESLLAAARSEEQRGAIITASVFSKAHTDAEGGARLLMEHPTAARPWEIFQAFVWWADADYAAAGAALDRVPGEIAEAALAGTARQTAYQDCAAAFALLEKHAERVTPKTIGTIVEAVENRAPIPPDIFTPLPDGPIRDQAYAVALQRWQKRDPQAAGAWLAEHPLPGAVRAQMEK